MPLVKHLNGLIIVITLFKAVFLSCSNQIVLVDSLELLVDVIVQRFVHLIDLVDLLGDALLCGSVQRGGRLVK